MIRKADAILATAGANEATTTESAPSDEEVSAKESSNSINEQTNVLVLCAGGGTSGLLANALNKAAEEYRTCKSGSWWLWCTYGYYERLSINYFSASSCF